MHIHKYICAAVNPHIEVDPGEAFFCKHMLSQIVSDMQCSDMVTDTLKLQAQKNRLSLCGYRARKEQSFASDSASFVLSPGMWDADITQAQIYWNHRHPKDLISASCVSVPRVESLCACDSPHFVLVPKLSSVLTDTGKSRHRYSETTGTTTIIIFRVGQSCASDSNHAVSLKLSSVMRDRTPRSRYRCPVPLALSWQGR